MTDILLLIMLLIMFGAWLWMIVIAFKNDQILWGVLRIIFSFIPGFIYGIVHWDKAKKPFILAIAAFVLWITSYDPTVTPAVTSGEMAPVLAFDTIQSAESFTEADFDIPGLKNMETWLVDTMLEKTRPIFAELGVNPKEYKPSISANSVFVIIADKKLGIIKIQAGDYVRSVAILGFMGSEFHRVTCLRKSNHDIPVWSGECGNKVQQVFGVSIKP